MDLTNAQPDSAEEALHWDLLRKQSSSYYELTLLVDAIEALHEWRVQEHKYVTMVPTPPTVPSALKHAYQDASVAMQPVLQGIFLRPADEDEEQDLVFFRTEFVPEVVIAYNTVLHAAGNLITRDSLLLSMELSATIAKGKTTDDASNGLVECFMQAGRMRELVQSFALTSKLMLLLHSTGREWKPKKATKGMDLAIWELGRAPQQEEEVVEQE
jgi:nuclear pore complex protein Nup107